MTEQRLLLAIDTSTEQTGIALFDGACLDEVSWSSCHEQTVLLLDEIDHQLRRRKVGAAGIGAVGVATGPGRFNALRVGMSVAKGLVLGLDIPILGISSLEATAHPWRRGDLPVAAVIDAGRGRLSWQLFDAPVDFDLMQPRNTSIEEFVEIVAGLDAGVCVSGEINSELAQRLADVSSVTVPPLAGRLGRAASVAELAYIRLRNDDLDDPVLLEPVYLHGLRSGTTA